MADPIPTGDAVIEPQARRLIVTEAQYSGGYLERVGKVVYRRRYESIGRTPEGHHVVRDPEPTT